jgi:hypothetical protein
MNLNLLAGLSLDENGILINADGSAVHLRQGDMDGACGPYCVAMALLASGKMKRDEISPGGKIDYRTRYGKLLKIIHDLEPMVLCGTYANDLCKMLAAHNLASGVELTGTGKNLMPEIASALKKNHPVILDVRSRKSDGLNHWTLAIGASENHLFLLDSGYELHPSNLWNATLTTKPSVNRFGYRYSNPWSCSDVEISTMIAVQ